MNTERVVVITGGIGALLPGRFPRNGDTVIATAVSDEAPKASAERTGRRSELRTIAAGISSEVDNAAGHLPVQPFARP
ncbi:hypothetical protein [Nonomuraea sp. NPDC049784]|uniref:hypothetical protein n=1 Tax=Nonomuraea sp. NPDC049784 TaxID=3154361 RepID=UPI0033EAFB4E